MKRLIIYFLLALGLGIPGRAGAQNLLEKFFLYYYQGQNNVQIIPMNMGCNCGIQVTVDGVTTIYTADQLNQPGHPFYTAYYSFTHPQPTNGTGGNNTGGTGSNGSGSNNGNFFDNDPDWIAFEIHLQMLRNQQQWQQDQDYQLLLNEYAFSYEATGGNGSEAGPGCAVDLVDQTVEYDFFDGYAPGPGSEPPPAQPPLPCTNRYLVGNHIMSFNSAQQNSITQRLFNGNQMAGVVMNGKTYKTTLAYQVVGVKDTRLYSNQCPNGPPSFATVNEQYLLDNPRLLVKFVNFDSLNSGTLPNGIKRVYGKDKRSGRNVTAFRGIPNNMAGLSFSLDSTNMHPATAGEEAIGIRYNPDGSFNKYYCIKLTAEDIEDMNAPLPKFLDTLKFKLQHPVVLPKWAREFLSLFPSIFLGPCTVNYVNEKLDTLHNRASYQNLPTENDRRLAERQSLAYNTVFGHLYCATNEESVKDAPCGFQAFTGMLHEMIATVDVGMMADALVEMVEHASAVLSPGMDSLVNGFKEIAGGEVSLGNFDYERFLKKLAERNASGFNSNENRLTKIADNFRRMFFTQCHATALPGGSYDICCYRKGQLTMMVLPIVLTGGNYLAVKLGQLAAKYGPKAGQAVKMLADAERLGAEVVYDATGRLLIKEADEIGADVISTQKRVADDIEITGEPDLAAVIDEGDLAVEVKPAPAPPYTNVIHETPGNKANRWNKVLNNLLQPFKRYKVGNITYQTDALGRVNEVTCSNLQRLARDRNQYQQSVKCKKLKDAQPGDQGGHLIGSQFDGAGEQINLVPMRPGINQAPGSYAAMEQQWANTLNAGGTVKNVKIELIYSGTSKRPVRIVVSADVNGVTIPYIHVN